MKELDPLIFLAVFSEMLGPLLWIMILGAIAGTLAFLRILARDRGLVARNLPRAELAGLLGGGLALVLMANVSSSGFTDAGGPADWFPIALVFGAGLVGTIVIVYSVLGWRQQSTA